MADRSVVVKLVANVSDYRRNLASAADDSKKFAVTNKQNMEMVGKASLALGTGLAVGVGMALKKFADFDQAMSNIKAATHESAGAMKQLREAALEAGERTAFSAVEAADGVEQLAKAGVSTAAILNGGLNGALDLAAAGGLAVGDAAEIAATALTQFKLEGAQVPHVADLLAAAAGKAQGGVQEMGMALKQAGLVASQTGLSIEETTAGLASFASAGLLGSDAGTSFKSMLQRLTPQSEEAAGEMERLGISAYDAQGNFIGLEAFAGNLQDSLAGLTVEQRNSAMATIFGSDAVRAASVLYSQGADGIAEWTDKVNDAGYAQETATLKLDNLKGDIEAFMGSLETALIRTGESGDGVARALVQQATDIVNAYNKLPQSAQSAVMATGALTAALALASGGFLVLAPRIVATRVALASLATTAPATTAAMVGLGKALGIGAVAVGAAIGVDQLFKAFADAPPGVNALVDSLADFAVTGKATGALAEVVGDDLDGLAKKMKVASENRWFSTSESHVDILEARDDIEALDQALASMVNSGHGVEAARLLMDAGVSSAEAAKHFDAYKEAQAGTSAQTKLTASAQEELADAVVGTTGSVVAQDEALSDLMEKVKGLSDLILGLRGDERSYQAALDDATAALKENGKTLDINTEKGRANEEALDSIASSAGSVLQAMADAGKPVSDITAKFGEQREALVKAAIGFGMTSAQAETYADSVLRIPDKKTTAITLTGADAALSQIERLQQYLAGLRNKTVTVRVDEVLGATVQRGNYSGRAVERSAAGGFISGPGTGTSDSIPALLSNGEYVIRASSVAKVGRATLDRINRFAKGGPVGYAAGGSVTNAPNALVKATAGLTSVADIQALVKAWDDYGDAVEQAARRQELFDDVAQASANMKVAKTTEQKTRTQREFNEARKALAEFDYAAARDRETAAVERQIAALEAQAAAEEAVMEANRKAYAERRAQQDNRFELGIISAKAYLEILNRRLDDEVAYSDAWMAIWRERESVLKSQADAEAELTKTIEDENRKRTDAVKDAADAQKSALDSLNRLLDQEAALHSRAGTIRSEHARAVGEVQARQVQAEADFYTRRSALARQFNDDEQRILAARRDSLANSTALDQQVAFKRGLPTDWLIRNAREQVEALTDWMSQLDLAREMGVSEDVITALGLDEGPQALYQLKALTSSSLGEIDNLNAQVAQRTEVAGQQTAREQQRNLGALGRELAAAREQYVTALDELNVSYAKSQQDLNDQLAELNAQLTADLAKVAEELAVIGLDQGRSYSEAIAAGIRSGLPGILSAVAEAQAALGALASAQAALGKAPTSAGSGGVLGGPFKRVRRATYDSGGWLQPGYTLAYNGTGQPERVLTASQAGGRTVNLNVDGVTIRETVDVDLLARRAEFLVSVGSM